MSDGRVRHGHRRPRGRARQRQASADEIRRRAEVLFGEQVLERRELRRESGNGPPGGETVAGETVSGEAAGDRGAVDAPVGADAGAVEGRVGGAWQERAGLAVRERVPVWLQARCGLERRSVVALTVVLVAAAVLAVQHFWAGRTQPVRAPEVVRAAAPFGAARADAAARPRGVVGGMAGAPIVVDVSGKVREPGVHRLPAGSRVADALRAAGGVRPGTKTDGLNRARFLVDGEQVLVGGAVPVPGAGAGVVVGGAVGPGGVGAGGSVSGVGPGPTAPVSLNTATVEQLDTLPGVGPVLAQHIIDYRTQHGGYRSVGELREVNGIGDRRFADLRNLVQP